MDAVADLLRAPLFLMHVMAPVYIELVFYLEESGENVIVGHFLPQVVLQY